MNTLNAEVTFVQTFFLPQHRPQRLRVVYEGLLEAVLWKIQQFPFMSSLKAAMVFKAYVAATSVTKCTRSRCSYFFLLVARGRSSHTRGASLHNQVSLEEGIVVRLETGTGRPVTTYVTTRRRLGTTLDSHRTLELGSHFRHSMSAIIGHCPRMSVAERTAACIETVDRRRRVSNRASRSDFLCNVCRTCTCTPVSVLLSVNERRISKRTRRLLPLISGKDYTDTLDTIYPA